MSDKVLIPSKTTYKLQLGVLLEHVLEIQGLSKRFERFKFGVFYLLIVKIR